MSHQVETEQMFYQLLTYKYQHTIIINFQRLLFPLFSSKKSSRSGAMTGFFKENYRKNNLPEILN